MSHALMLGTTSGGEVEKVLVSSSGKLEVDATITGGGDATAANQVTMIGHLSTIEGDTTSLDAKVVACDTTGKATLSEQQSQTTHLATIASDTTSLDAKVVACDTTGKATLTEQQSQTTQLTTIAGDTTSLDAKVVACDTTGKATLSEQQTQTGHLATISSDTTSLDAKVVACNTGAVVVSSGSITETNSASIASSVGKITQGYDATVASGGSGLQQNLIYGLDSNTGDLDAIKVNTNGNLQVIVEEAQKETTAAQLWTAQSIGAGASAQTASIDMQNHRYVSVYGDTTSTLGDLIKIEFSDDNTNWYASDQSYIYPDYTTGVFAHTVTEQIIVRYIRFSTTNTDASAHTYNLKYSIMKN